MHIYKHMYFHVYLRSRSLQLIFFKFAMDEGINCVSAAFFKKSEKYYTKLKESLISF